jgi:hypothetical protein
VQLAVIEQYELRTRVALDVDGPGLDLRVAARPDQAEDGEAGRDQDRHHDAGDGCDRQAPHRRLWDVGLAGDECCQRAPGEEAIRLQLVAA